MTLPPALLTAAPFDAWCATYSMRGDGIALAEFLCGELGVGVAIAGLRDANLLRIWVFCRYERGVFWDPKIYPAPSWVMDRFFDDQPYFGAPVLSNPPPRP